MWQTTFLHRHALRCCVASPRGGAWRFPKIISILFGPRAATEKSPGDPARRGFVTFFPWLSFGHFQAHCIFGNRHVSSRRSASAHKRAHAHSRDQNCRSPARASEPLGLLDICYFSQPGLARGFRLLGADLGCLACFHCAAPLRGWGPSSFKEAGPWPRRGALNNAGHPKFVPRSRKTRVVPGHFRVWLGQGRGFRVRRFVSF